MIKSYKYNTVTDAITSLRAEGFTADFELAGDAVLANGKRLTASDLHLEVVHRYEGPSDPADEATVYGLRTRQGAKGILVTADGIYSDVSSPCVLTRLHRSKMGHPFQKRTPY